MGYHPYTFAIFGAMADKDIDGVLKPMMDLVDYWYCTDLPIARAAKASDLAKQIQLRGKEAEVFAQAGAAYQMALDKAGEGDRIIVFGSFYTVAGVMAYRTNQAH
jgi:dihydrofolate synthase/folylpolyglutamate synthase